jgi:hypothetical protein
MFIWLKKYSKDSTHGNLAASIQQCEFHKDSVEFLGYIISKDGITITEDKVEAIRYWESPKTQKNI